MLVREVVGRRISLYTRSRWFSSRYSFRVIYLRWVYHYFGLLYSNRNCTLIVFHTSNTLTVLILSFAQIQICLILLNLSMADLFSCAKRFSFSLQLVSSAIFSDLRWFPSIIIDPNCLSWTMMKLMGSLLEHVY